MNRAENRASAPGKNFQRLIIANGDAASINMNQPVLLQSRQPPRHDFAHGADAGGDLLVGQNQCHCFVLLTALIATLAAIGGAALLVNIFERKQEAARILGESINFSRQGQNALRGKTQPASQPGPQSSKSQHRAVAQKQVPGITCQ
jgi:hypothetical protein